MTFQALADAAITNIGLAFEWVVLLIVILGALIFFANDFKLGMIILLLTTGGLFIWFYETGLNYTLPLVVFFMSLVILALTFYAVDKTSTTGGFN